MIELNDLEIKTSLDEALVSRTKGGARKFDAVGPNSLHAIGPNSLHAIAPNSLTDYGTEYETDAETTTSIIAILIG